MVTFTWLLRTYPFVYMLTLKINQSDFYGEVCLLHTDIIILVY